MGSPVACVASVLERRDSTLNAGNYKNKAELRGEKLNGEEA